jgi:hypothetical protein
MKVCIISRCDSAFAILVSSFKINMSSGFELRISYSLISVCRLARISGKTSSSSGEEARGLSSSTDSASKHHHDSDSGRDRYGSVAHPDVYRNEDEDGNSSEDELRRQERQAREAQAREEERRKREEEEEKEKIAQEGRDRRFSEEHIKRKSIEAKLFEDDVFDEKVGVELTVTDGGNDNVNNGNGVDGKGVDGDRDGDGNVGVKNKGENATGNATGAVINPEPLAPLSLPQASEPTNLSDLSDLIAIPIAEFHRFVYDICVCTIPIAKILHFKQPTTMEERVIIRTIRGLCGEMGGEMGGGIGGGMNVPQDGTQIQNDGTVRFTGREQPQVPSGIGSTHIGSAPNTQIGSTSAPNPAGLNLSIFDIYSALVSPEYGIKRGIDQLTFFEIVRRFNSDSIITNNPNNFDATANNFNTTNPSNLSATRNYTRQIDPRNDPRRSISDTILPQGANPYSGHMLLQRSRGFENNKSGAAVL